MLSENSTNMNMLSKLSSLNPCFNGICSLSDISLRKAGETYDES